MENILLLACVVALSSVAIGNENPPSKVIADITRNDKTVCHGVLIDSQWVLTVSDCIESGKIEKYSVIIDGKFKRTITSKQMMDSRDSVALLSLSKKVKVEPVVIAKPGELVKVKLSGSMTKIIGDDVDIDIIPNKNCEQEKNYNRKRGRDLCFKPVDVQKRCSNVAGSPILSYNFKRWSLLGLTLTSKNCYDNPSLGVDVTKYRAWARTVLKEPIPCHPSEYRCSDGTCLPNSKVCDGQMDCPCSGEDEHSCGCSSWGRKFLVGFINLLTLENECNDLTPQVYLTSMQPTTTQIEGPNFNLTVSVDGSERVVFPANVYPELLSRGKVSNYGIEITSDNQITVVAVVSCEKNTEKEEIAIEEIDGTLVYPENCMSNMYVIDAYSDLDAYGYDEITVVGIEPGTSVTILTSRESISAIIDRRETLFFSAKYKIAAAVVTADKNISVFTGNDYDGLIRSGKGTLFEQMPPLATLGRVYIASIISPSDEFVYRISGAYDNTRVTIRDETGDILQTLSIDRGEYRQVYVQQKTNSTLQSIVADQGILVTQYETSPSDLFKIGDPAVVALPALTQCESEFSFTLPIYMYLNTVVVYISECYGTEGLRLNGAPVNEPEINSEKIDIPGFGRYIVLTIHIVPKNLLIPEFTTLSHTIKGAKMCAILRGTRYQDHALWRIGGLI